MRPCILLSRDLQPPARFLDHTILAPLQKLFGFAYDQGSESDDANTGPFWLVYLGGYVDFKYRGRYHGSRSLRYHIPITITGQFCVGDYICSGGLGVCYRHYRLVQVIVCTMYRESPIHIYNIHAITFKSLLTNDCSAP